MLTDRNDVLRERLANSDRALRLCFSDYNRVRFEIETDGTVSPSSALHKAAVILQDHFTKVGAVEVKTFDAPESGVVKKKATRKKKEE